MMWGRNGRRNRRRNRKRGSMIVEASIMLPVFVIMIVTFCWLIRACVLEIAVYNTVENEVKKICAAGFTPAPVGIQNTLDEAGIDGSEYRMTGLLPGFHIAGVGGFTRMMFTYDTDISVPLPMVSQISLRNAVTYRPWNGYENPGTPMGFDAMRGEGDGHPVYVFPTAGEKYHSRGCRYTESCARAVTLSPSVRSEFSACPLCTFGNEENGQTVYTFEYGTCYHRSGCDAVTKYLIEMDRQDAVAKGYAACSVCGG